MPRLWACLYQAQSCSHLCTLITSDLQQPKTQAAIAGARRDFCLQSCAPLGHSHAITAAACLKRPSHNCFHPGFTG